MGKLLVVAGLIIAGVGVLVMMGLPIGRLPGDFTDQARQRDVLLPARDVDPGEHHSDAAAVAAAAVTAPFLRTGISRGL